RVLEGVAAVLARVDGEQTRPVLPQVAGAQPVPQPRGAAPGAVGAPRLVHTRAPGGGGHRGARRGDDGRCRGQRRRRAGGGHGRQAGSGRLPLRWAYGNPPQSITYRTGPGGATAPGWRGGGGSRPGGGPGPGPVRAGPVLFGE